MEDAHVTLLTLEENTTDKNTFFAVYDGHGGKLLANSFTDSSLKLSLILHRKHRREVCGEECSQATNFRRGIS
jgi:protein phosphatase 2C family protein 2/3